MLFHFFFAMPDKNRKLRSVFLALLILAGFSYPFLSIADKPLRIAGVPLLFVYVFAGWLLAIILLYRAAEKKETKKKPDA
jgi:glucan phosphoethanolaminetransferase (alkaline phosphatase superfamily)